MSLKQNISIVSTIHQPNAEVLQMFDKLYVLAEGGVCVYSGTPQQLPNHLSECNIICTENQVPIETLITIGAKGRDDPRIVLLENRTKESFNENFLDNRINETKVKRIEKHSKRFNWRDIYILLNRSVSEFFGYKYISDGLSILTFVLSASLLALAFGKVGQYDDCIVFNDLNNRSCIEQIEIDHKINQNINLIADSIWLGNILHCILYMMEKIKRLNVFANEHQSS